MISLNNKIGCFSGATGGFLPGIRYRDKFNTAGSMVNAAAGLQELQWQLKR